MANIDNIIPHIIKWEAATKGQNMTNEQLFDKAKLNGYANDHNDRGGATMVGITISTYTAYRRKKGFKTTTVADLKAIDYKTWRDVLKVLFWDRWKADQINNQSLAELVVDWMFGSGKWGIINPQQCLGIADDGIVGAKTIAAINTCDQEAMYNKIWKRRKNFYYGIVAKNPSQKKWLHGWLNRLNDQHYDK